MQVAGRRRLVAQVSASRPPLLLNDPLALAALGALPGEFDRDSARTAWSAEGIPEPAQDELWAAFDAAGLFSTAAEKRSSWWAEFGWREARTYHEATRDYPFLQMDEPGAFAHDSQRMHEYGDEGAAPSVYQHLGDGGTVELPGLRPGESPDEWLERMSADVCFGERAQITIAGGSRCVLKSIPSGGARHPTEIFLAAFDVPGVPEGIYHYDVERHALDRVRSGQHRDAFADATLDLFAKYETPPAAALVFTSRVERAMWRYRDPRSFRAIQVDAGHGVMAYRHVGRMLGFRTYALQKMRDREVAGLLGLDLVVQPPLYVGTLVP
jgi:SagB-type dehydrogenase family enzyme